MQPFQKQARLGRLVMLASVQRIHGGLPQSDHLRQQSLIRHCAQAKASFKRWPLRWRPSPAQGRLPSPVCVRLRTFATKASALSQRAAELSEGATPRPESIEWKKDLTNFVGLIGTLGRDIQTKYLDTGHVLASSSLRVQRTGTKQQDMWFLLQFWDDMAQIAADHLKKEDQIFVSGSVFVETFTGKDELQKTLCKVIVKEVKFVGASGTSMNKDGAVLSTSLEEKWKDVFQNPSQWWDNRSNKANPRSPDFKHKVSGDALWIDNMKTPAWVKERLEEKADLLYGNDTEVSSEVEKLWQAFFANPSDWWDNRDSKKSPKHPDFRNKSSGEALWLGRLTPAWVKSQLAILDSKLQTVKETGKPQSSFDDESIIFF